MGFIDNAREGTIEMTYASNIRKGMAEGKSNPDDLVEVTVRVKRMTMVKYAEDPFVIPRFYLPNVHELAASFRRDLDVIEVDYTPGNSTYLGRAFVMMDETVVIEVVHRDYTPDPSEIEDGRRSKFRDI
jgi:hypothetical protein